jgi:hypothetical protein
MSVTSKRFQPTPEQLTLSAERKSKKAKLSASATPAPVEETKGRILKRKWIELSIKPDATASRRIKVMTWNVSGTRSSHKVINN